MTTAGDLEEPRAGTTTSDALGPSPSDELLRALADVGDGGAPELEPGARVGRFRVERVLGRGGMGVVYAARDLGLDRSVAIKLLHGRLVERADRRARFLREAKVAASVDHPNVARILEAFEDDAGVVLVFELVAGHTLREMLREGPFSLEEITRVGGAIAEALDAAHRAGVVHRDLKPDNVMCSPDGAVKVLDFGLAKRAPGEHSERSAEVLTVDGEILGSPGYMSPEQALGHETDTRSDVFSLGVLLYELATGRRPFAGATRMETILGVLLVAANSSPVDPVVPSAVLQTLERPCLTLVGLGSETLWCVGDVDIVGVPPNSIDEQVLRAMRYDAATGAYTWYELFDSYDQPDEPGRGFFATEVATNGPDLYFVAREVVDGTGEIVSTLYRARDAGTTFEVTTVLCDLPEITDMTLTNGSLYYATFEPDLAKLDRHGLWRLDL